MRELPARQLITDIQHGDKIAMETFYRRYSPFLYAVCRRYVPEHETARDILQDSFIRLFSAIGTFRLDRKLDEQGAERYIKAWAARIVANVALNYLRDNARLQFVPVDICPAEDIPDNEIDADALPLEAITSIIDSLPPNYRIIFSLFAIEGYSHKEIARLTGISPSLSATNYHRARALLKQKIKLYLSTDMLPDDKRLD